MAKTKNLTSSYIALVISLPDNNFFYDQDSFRSSHVQNRLGMRVVRKAMKKKDERCKKELKQARKSSEDAQAGGYTQFEEVWAG